MDAKIERLLHLVNIRWDKGYIRCVSWHCLDSLDKVRIRVRITQKAQQVAARDRIDQVRARHQDQRITVDASRFSHRRTQTKEGRPVKHSWRGRHPETPRRSNGCVPANRHS